MNGSLCKPPTVSQIRWQILQSHNYKKDQVFHRKKMSNQGNDYTFKVLKEMGKESL